MKQRTKDNSKMALLYSFAFSDFTQIVLTKELSAIMVMHGPQAPVFLNVVVSMGT